MINANQHEPNPHGEITNRYGAASIRRGLLHFVTGKAVTALSGLAILFMVVRALPVDQFAAYSALTAFVEVFTALAGFGLTHLALRYLPELNAQHLDGALNRMIMGVLTLRTITLCIAVAIVYWYSPEVAGFVGLMNWSEMFRLFMIVVFARVSFHFLYQILESLLRQRAAQIGVVVVSLAKFGAVTTLFVTDALSLEAVIWIEAVTETIGCLILIYFMRRDFLWRHNSNEGWFGANWRRMVRFGLHGYGQHLALLFYGSSPNRLLGSRYLEVGAMAGLGFVQALSDVIRRYMPAQMFSGLIRPVFLANYSQTQDFQQLVSRVNTLFKISCWLLGIPLMLMCVAGKDVFQLVSGGKYGEGESLLMAGFIIVLALDAWRGLLDILAQAVERMDMLLYSSLLLSLSLLCSIPMIGEWGAFSIVLANVIGLLLSSALVGRWLAHCGHVHRHDWLGLVKIIMAVAVAVLAGRGIDALGIHWLACVIISLLVYLALSYLLKPLNASEMALIKSLRKEKTQRSSG